MRCDVAKATGLAGRVAGREPTQRGHRVWEKGLVWTRCGLLRALPGSWLVTALPLQRDQLAAASGWTPGSDVSGGRTGAGTSSGTSHGTVGPPKLAGHWGAACIWGRWGGGTTHPVIRAARAQG